MTTTATSSPNISAQTHTYEYECETPIDHNVEICPRFYQMTYHKKIHTIHYLSKHIQGGPPCVLVYRTLV